MVWTAARVVIALVAAYGIYAMCTRIIAAFTRVPPAEPDPSDLEPVDLRYRCIVCGAELTMTAVPGGEEPEPPRHCREDMVPVADAPSG